MKVPKFVFIHIPRTAGGTINHILRKMYENDIVILLHPGRKFLKKEYPKQGMIQTIDEIRGYSIISGHVPIAKIIDLKRPIITWLRHPVDRVISHFRWSFRKQKRLGIDIIKFAEDDEMRNGMSYLTGGDLSKFSFVGITENFDKDIKKMFDFLGVGIPRYINKHVSNKKIKIGVDEETRKIIEELNDEDMNLYDEAVRMDE